LKNCLSPAVAKLAIGNQTPVIAQIAADFLPSACCQRTACLKSCIPFPHILFLQTFSLIYKQDKVKSITQINRFLLPVL